MKEWPFAPLKMFGYDLIMVDPPWPFTHYSPKGEEKSFKIHYGEMPLTQIKALPIGELARDDCLLWLWATGSRLDQALAVLTAWGFTFKTEIVWRKVTPTGKIRMGPGYVARTMHEPVLIGTVGKPRLLKAFPSLFDGIAREHSRKPEEAFALVEKHMAPGYRAELFSRASRIGWDTWGYEAGKFDPVVKLQAPANDDTVAA